MTIKNDRISVTLGATLNLGNFNSARVDAYFETDVRPEENITEAYERAWSVVDDEITRKTEEAAPE